MTRAVSRRVAGLVLVLATSAQAQTTTTAALTLRAGSNSTDTFTLGASDCSLRLRVRWQYSTSVGILCTPLKLWGTDGECGEEPGVADVRYDDVPALTVTTAREGSFDVPIAELPGFKAGTTTPCGSANLSKTHKICGVIEYSQASCGFTTQPKLSASPLKIVYDTLPPTAPVITGSTALDGSIRVNFAVDADTQVVLAEVRPQGATDFTSGGEAVASAGAIRVSGLTNGTTYDIQLRAKDSAGNVSLASDLVAATPIRTIGFWGAYRAAGGADQGGCASAPGLGAAAAWITWVALRRRRRR